MDGNRGAKGSIKDRLISMLYRIRYNSKKRKEDDYKVETKKNQLNYLNSLKQFDETEDINTLNKEDKDKVNNVKLTIKQNTNYNKHKTEQNTEYQEKKNKSKAKQNVTKITLIRKPVGINNTVKKINIPNDKKINLKKEIKKTTDEIVILKEVNSFIKKSKEKINEIQKSIDELKEDTKNKNQDLNKINEKYTKLKTQIDSLKNQYDSVKDKYDLSEFKIYESIKTIGTIENYKTLASLNEIEMLVRVCKKEIESIKKIEVVKKEETNVGININSIKESQDSVKVKFVKSKEKVNEIKSIEDVIRSEIEEQKRIVNDMYDKVSYIEKNVIKTKEYEGKGRLLSSLFKITLGMLSMSFSKKKIFGVALGATLVNRGLRQLNHNYNVKEKIKIDVKYEDLTDKLNRVEDKIGYTNMVLDDSLNEISKLKNNFITEYKEYSNILPNYNEQLNTINSLENTIKENKKMLQNSEENISYEKDENSKKLKKVNEIKGRY